MSLSPDPTDSNRAPQRISAGVHTVVPTTFHADGTVDLDSLSRVLEMVAADGVDGVLILGVMGEAPRLLPAERQAIIARSMETVGDRIEVTVGATHPGSDGTRALARAAQEAGATAVLISPPKLERANPEAIVSYFQHVADGLDIEIVLQDHPGSTGVFTSVDLIARLARDIDQIRSIKMEDPPTPLKVTEIRERAPQDLRIFGGLGGVFMYEELLRGADGTMTGFAFPAVLVEIQQLYARGETEAARTVFEKYLPLIRYEFQPAVGLSVRKYAYKLRGAVECEIVRQPALQLDDISRAEVRDMIERLGLLDAAATGAVR
jgi:4-hydroxy-tetrahydrodipicolinate synthase